MFCIHRIGVCPHEGLLYRTHVGNFHLCICNSDISPELQIHMFIVIPDGYLITPTDCLTSLSNFIYISNIVPTILNHQFFSFIFISWRLITLQYCSGFCHMLTWISHGFTCVPHPNPPSHLPLHPIPLGLPSAPGLSTCLMYPAWAGDLFHLRQYTCFDVVLSKHPTLAFSHRVQKSVLYISVSFPVLHIGLLYLNSIYMC